MVNAATEAEGRRVKEESKKHGVSPLLERSKPDLKAETFGIGNNREGRKIIKTGSVRKERKWVCFGVSGGRIMID